MERQPLIDITNVPPSSPSSPDAGANTAGSGSSNGGGSENDEPPEALERAQCQIAVSARNWKQMDDHLLTRMLYMPNGPNSIDAENLRDFYKAKRNGWLDSETTTFLSEKLFHALPTLDLDLYTLREGMFEKALSRYQYSKEQSDDLNFHLMLGKCK